MGKQELYEKMRKETVILWNDLEDAYVKITDGGTKFFARFPGEKEYPVDSSSKMVTDALILGKEIDLDEYESA